MPFSVLISDLKKTENFTKTVVSSTWLLDLYSFVYILPTKQKENQTRFQSPFLGFANPSSYKLLGLPDLNSATEEINDLAISSGANRKNILVGESATKEEFLLRVQNGHERIVLAAHAVPQGWEGLVDEPSIVMNSIEGDYFLNASEISSLNIASDMVILSSCNDPKQEMNLLYKSFLVAGTKSVLHSAWNLESRFAKDFTTEYFQLLWLEENEEKHIALNNIAKKFKNNYSREIYIDPAYWGNFRMTYSTL